MLFLVPLLGLLASSRADQVSINGVVDKILLEAKEFILKSGNEELPLDEIHDVFTYRFNLFKVRSYLHCWDGAMQKTSTLQRVGDVRMTNHSDEVTLQIPLNMTELEFKFNNCRVDIAHIVRQTSQVFVVLEENKMNVNVTLSLNDAHRDCTVTIGRLDIAYNEHHYKFYAGDLVADTQDRILPFFLRHLSRQLTSFFSRYLNDLIKDYLPEAKLCFNTL